MPTERVCKLISALCDGAITSDELRLLERELIDSADARAIYVEYLEHEASLEWELSSKKVVEGIQAEEVEEFLALANSTGLQFNCTKPARKRTIPHPFLSGLIAAAILAAIGIASWGVFSRQSPFSNQSTADLRLAHAGENVGSVQPLTSNCLWYVESRSENDNDKVAVGETLRVVEGEAQITYYHGVTVVLAAPTVFEFTAPNAARLIQGKLRGHVAMGAEGFVVDTPRASVVDYGTEFGINVDGAGTTDVAVFEGEVGIEGRDSENSLRLKMGDGVRLDKYGAMSRLVAFESRHFPAEDYTLRSMQEPIIADIRDNTDQSDNMKFYEIVVRGLGEDARAFVDREFHQWNGHTSAGMPPYLLGADYVRMFNNDKIDTQFELEVTIGQPAMLFVFVDDRNHIPDWLSASFEDTGDSIGLDTGPFTDWNNIRRLVENTTGVGPGESIDSVFSIWRMRVEEPCTLKLGTAEPPHERTNMYALAAVPLE